MRLARVKVKEIRRKREQGEAEAANAIATVVQDSSDDEEARRFWMNLEPIKSCAADGNRDIFKHTVDKPRWLGITRGRQLRVERLMPNPNASKSF